LFMGLFKNKWYLLCFLAAMLWILPLRGQEALPDSNSGRIAVQCEISGLTVWVDGVRIGTTPVPEFDETPGEHTVQVQNPDPLDWLSRDWEKKIKIGAGERILLTVTFPEYVWVGSMPIGARVYRGDQLLGETPLLVRRVQAEGDKLEIKKSGYQEHILLLNDAAGSRVYIELFKNGLGQGPSKPAHRLKKGWLIGAGVFALLSGITGYYFKDRAERSYEKYMNTAHPDKMDQYFNEAAKFDRLSGIFYGIGEVSLSVTVVLSIKRIRSK